MPNSIDDEADLCLVFESDERWARTLFERVARGLDSRDVRGFELLQNTGILLSPGVD